MPRTAQEIADGVLGCVPESAPEKGTLRRRFRKIMDPAMVPDPRFSAPEVRGFHDQRRIGEICRVCAEVLGNPAGVDWKERIVQYLAAGDQPPADTP